MTPLTDTHLPAAIAARLSNADPGVRRVALIELADEQDEALLPWLIAALTDDPVPELRTEAAQRLAGWETLDAVTALTCALRDDSGGVREAAAQSLSELKDARAGAMLLPLAEDADAFVRAAVLRALRELRLPAAAAPALISLSHASAGVRREAVAVLGWLKQRDALPALARLANTDPEADVRRAATGALGLADVTSDPDRRVARDALLAALRDDAWSVREEAASTLGKLRLDDTGPAAALMAALDDAYWQVRLRAARALGQLRITSAVAPLGVALSHSISNLRKEAAIALGEIGDIRALPLLEAAEADTDPEVRKLSRIAIARLRKVVDADA
jgi:HEAT repeat protein